MKEKKSVIENGMLKKYFGDKTNIVIPEGVEVIAEHAVVAPSAIRLTIPESVVEIHKEAFIGMHHLESITVDPENKRYRSVDNCLIDTGYKDVILVAKNGIIPCDNTVTHIKSGAFCSMNEPVNVVIPANIGYIETEAFANCNDIESITVDPENRYYYSENNCLISKASREVVLGCKNSVIPESKNVIAIGKSAFNSQEYLEKIRIPDNIRTIKEKAFYCCTNLKNIKLSENLRSIEESAFEHCCNLMSAVFPESLECIGHRAFAFCSHLGGVFIPANVEVIRCAAFANCPWILSIDVDPENEYFHSYGDCLIDTEHKVLVQGCSESIIPADGSVGMIEEFAFAGCTDLEFLEIPDSVTYIGDSAFFDCKSLSELVLPKNLKRIGSYTFYGCENLASLTLPENLEEILENAFFESYVEELVIPEKTTKIEKGAFDGCVCLEHITIPKTVTYMPDDLFDGYYELTIHAPEGSYAQQYAKEKNIKSEAI